MSVRFTQSQIYFMKRLIHGVSQTEFLKWNQVPLRGLYMRRMFRFGAKGEGFFAICTQRGWDEYQKTLIPALRKESNWGRAEFQHSGRSFRKEAQA